MSWGRYFNMVNKKNLFLKTLRDKKWDIPYYKPNRSQPEFDYWDPEDFGYIAIKTFYNKKENKYYKFKVLANTTTRRSEKKIKVFLIEKNNIELLIYQLAKYGKQPNKLANKVHKFCWLIANVPKYRKKVLSSAYKNELKNI